MADSNLIKQIEKIDIPKTEITVDIDHVAPYYPTLTCVCAGKKEADDQVSLQTTYVDGDKAIMFRFKSEVLGKVGLFGIDGGEFSNFAIFVTSKGNFFASALTGINGKIKPDLSKKYILQPKDRATLIIAQALDCYAYSLAENKNYSDFEKLHEMASYLDQNRNALNETGVQSESECEWWNFGCKEMVQQGKYYSPIIFY